MASLVDLDRAVRSALDGQRLGSPVFVRYFLHTHDQMPMQASRLARMAAAVGHWIGQPLEHIYALGDRQHLQAVLHYRHGATALIAAANRDVCESAADLFVLGNHGALYHESGAVSLEDESGSWEDQAFRLLIERAIEHSLHSGKPATVAGEETA